MRPFLSSSFSKLWSFAGKHQHPKRNHAFYIDIDIDVFSQSMFFRQMFGNRIFKNLSSPLSGNDHQMFGGNS